MFRLKVIAIFLVLTVGGVLALQAAISDQKEEVSQRMRAEARRGHLLYAQAAEVRIAKLRALAQHIANSEVGAYLATLQDFRNEIVKVQEDAHRQFPGSVNADPDALQASREIVVAGHEAFLSGFVESLAKRVAAKRGADAWAEGSGSREAFVTARRDALKRCTATAWNKCFHEFVFRSLEPLVSQLRAPSEGKGSAKGVEGVLPSMRCDNPYGVCPDRVVISDNRHDGIADVDRPRWSVNSPFPEREFVRTVGLGQLQQDTVGTSSGRLFRLVTAVPIHDGKFRGTVLVGLNLDDELLRREGALLGRNVSYFHGKRLVASTLDLGSRGELNRGRAGIVGTANSRPVIKQTGRYVTQYFPLKGNFRNHDMWVALSMNHHEAIAALDELQALIPLLGLAFFLLGLLLFSMAFRTFLKPYTAIDSGINEIINGNRDYVFKFDYNEKMWSSTAQSLDVMLDALLERSHEAEHPEDGATWAAHMLEEVELRNVPTVKPTKDTAS